MTFKVKQKVSAALFNRRISGVVKSMRGDTIVIELPDGSTHRVDASKVQASKAARSPLRKAPAVALVERDDPITGEPLLEPRPAARAQPKLLPLRSRVYLAYVRSKPCAVCGRRESVEASHHGKHGIGTKPDDFLSIPLCWMHHNADWHQHGTLNGWTRAETEIFITQNQHDLLIPWLIEKHGADAVNGAIVASLLGLIRARIANP